MLIDDLACMLLDVPDAGARRVELAELIKRRERSKHIPIIFVISASKRGQERLQGYSEGAVDDIFKPVDAKIPARRSRSSRGWGRRRISSDTGEQLTPGALRARTRE